MKEEENRFERKNNITEFKDIRSISNEFRSSVKKNKPIDRRGTQSRSTGDWSTYLKSPDKKGQDGQAEEKASRDEKESKKIKKTDKGKTQKFKKPAGKASTQMRNILTIIVILVAVFLILLICVFMLFKVKKIEVEGESIYSAEKIIELSNYHLKDNLLFLSVADREELLAKELPYIQEVEITRKLPGTIKIHVTAAKVIACVEYATQYVKINSDGKILEISDEPEEGVMIVRGLDIDTAELGGMIASDDTVKFPAFLEIFEELYKQEVMNEMSMLVLSDIYNILLYYQDRIEMKLGNTASLIDKVQMGLSVVRKPENIAETDQGILDVSLRSGANKAILTLLQGKSFEEGRSSTNARFASNRGRGDDIPNAPYRGKKTSETEPDDVSYEEEDASVADE